jgi:hypothetical protein
MAQFSQLVNTPLAAGQQLTSSWLPVDPQFPYATVQAASDQAGSLQIYESDQVDGSATPLGGMNVPATLVAGVIGAPNSVTVRLRALYWRVVYTNGATAQTLFSYNLFSSMIPADPGASAATAHANRTLDLILRELKAQSLLLMWLKDPLSVGPQFEPFGLDDSTLGQVFPGAPAIAPIPPPPQQPIFS